MTNQDVINFLNQIRKILLDDKSWLESTIQPINEAFDKAISALQEQEAKNSNESSLTQKGLDTISRQAAIDELKRISFSHWFEYGEYLSEDTREIKIISSSKALEVIEALPSAQPEQRWIPVSETVDIPDHEILACDKYGELMFGYLAYMDDQWLCESDREMMYDPIAWREKPEPYRAERITDDV